MASIDSSQEKAEARAMMKSCGRFVNMKNIKEGENAISAHPNCKVETIASCQATFEPKRKRVLLILKIMNKLLIANRITVSARRSKSNAINFDQAIPVTETEG